MIRTLAAALVTSTCIVALATPAAAQTREYNIPAGSLKSALDAYVRQSGRQVLYRADEVRSARSRGARGQLSAEAALANLLAGSGFTTRLDGNLIAIVKTGSDATVEAVSPPGIATAGSAAANSESTEILVTGSRIRGAEPTSPVIRVTGEQMKDSGLPTLGDVVRNIPQNWAGGQNPGVAPGAQGVDNRNVTSSSTINLRGLGPDATLTLLNGHRLAYDFSTQGVDVGAIPIAAIDRLEVVADGASALYGSDAVAGVVNVLLKRDFDGLATTARFGAATDGGDVQQEYGMVAGQTWRGGGVMAVYDFQKNTPILSRQRSYTQTLQDDNHLYPAISQHSVILTGHQGLTDALTFSADATYSWRTTNKVESNTATQVPTAEGAIADVETETLSITPRLDLALGDNWRLSLLGTYAQSKSDSISNRYINSIVRYSDRALYDNKTYNAELSADGTLFNFNSNGVGLAVGAGYRLNSLDQSVSTASPGVAASTESFYGENESKYAFGELELPFITPANDASIRKLSLSAAIRYESYRGGDSVATPKIGGIFSPFDSLEIKASWGKSFKAPTLYQRFVTTTAYLDMASFYGFPGSGTAIEVLGGNPGLKSERSEMWTLTAAYTPQFAPGLRFEISYFDIRYRDRVVRGPIASYSSAYSDPSYQALITRNPSITQIDDVVALSPFPLINFTGGPLDPETVVAIIDNRNVNISTQELHGFDLNLTYDIKEVFDGDVRFGFVASHLRSRQMLLPGTAETQLAGTVFDPPKWRGRGSLTWQGDAITLNAAANYRGSLTDDRRTPSGQVGSMTTFDLSARITRIAASGPFANMEIGLTALNVFNEKPAPIWTSLARYAPYDSTNDSPVGRFVGITIAKQW